MTKGWIDVHAHFSPPSTAEERNARWHAMREALFLAPEPFRWTIWTAPASRCNY
jgi:hypothetical protein